MYKQVSGPRNEIEINIIKMSNLLMMRRIVSFLGNLWLGHEILIEGHNCN